LLFNDFLPLNPEKLNFDIRFSIKQEKYPRFSKNYDFKKICAKKKFFKMDIIKEKVMRKL